MVEVKFESEKMKVKTEYNSYFVKRAKELGGKWEKPYWVFPDENEDVVRQTLLDIYGEDGTPSKKIKIDINLDEYEGVYSRSVQIENLVIANRIDYYRRVTLNGETIILKGGFAESWGDKKKVFLGQEEGTVLRTSIPETIFEKVKGKKGIYLVEEGEEGRKRRLQKEREELLKRIAEIDKELGKMK